MVERPAPGEVVVEALGCSDQRLSGGEGRIGSDLYVATDRFRGVLRHPEDALTIAHVGGLSLLDLGTWPSGLDRLHEAVPIVRGGWLDVEEWSIDDGTVLVSGTVVSLPDQPAEGAGEPATVRWVFDGPRIHAEGAEGFYVHPRGFVKRDAEAFMLLDLVIRDDGVDVDLGGAVRTRSPTLWVDRPEAAWSREGPLTTVHTEASELELQVDGVIVGRTTVPDDAHALDVERVDAVRAIGSARAPGPWVSIGDDAVDAPLGPLGIIRVVLPGSRGAVMTWTSDDGRSGRRAFDPGGGMLGLGAGQFELAIAEDPRRAGWSTTVDVPEGETVEVHVPSRGERERVHWALVDLRAPADRSRTWRGTDIEAVRLAAGQGADVAAFLMEDDTTLLDPWDLTGGALLAHGGMIRRGMGPNGPWEVAAWPVLENTRKNAHGVFGAPTDDPLTAAVAAWGGSDELRHVQVDLPTLAALGPAHTLPFLPDLVRLEAPDDQLASWAPWLDRLDEGRTLGPTGPVTWVPVPDRDLLTHADVDQALFDGLSSAGSGPLIILERHMNTLLLQRLDGSSGQLEMWTDMGLARRAEGSVLRQAIPDGARWALAVHRDGAAWAVAGPLWLVDPATGAPVGAGPGSMPPAGLR